MTGWGYGQYTINPHLIIIKPWIGVFSASGSNCPPRGMSGGKLMLGLCRTHPQGRMFLHQGAATMPPTKRNKRRLTTSQGPAGCSLTCSPNSNLDPEHSQKEQSATSNITNTNNIQIICIKTLSWQTKQKGQESDNN